MFVEWVLIFGQFGGTFEVDRFLKKRYIEFQRFILAYPAQHNILLLNLFLNLSITTNQSWYTLSMLNQKLVIIQRV